MSSGKPTLVLRCAGKKPLRMGPGERIRIGRHASNDLVLSDDTVSRFHAAVEWDPDEDRPQIVDNDSANGVEVDGELIDARCHLPGGNQVVIGRFTIAVEVTEGAAGRRERMVAELNDSDSVVLITEKGGDRVSGRAATPAELHRVFLDLEGQQRTGTLTVRAGLGLGKVTFCQGLVMTASSGPLAGRPALRELLLAPSAIYAFSRELKPVDEPLNLSIREYLEAELAELTKKIALRPSTTEDPPTRPRG
ncbi:MAG: FHA domain-containing protein [Planctomycetes bacterium]|nr:FHA domain-containing protein [Planctomycetota bacterium]